MKNKLLPLISAGALLFAGGLVVGHAESAPAATADKHVKLMKVVKISGADAVREFQANVQLVQAQRKAVAELKEAYDKETNVLKKAEIKSKLDAAFAKLSENNELMTKTYQFSILRNYVMEIESANIYVELTPEEAAKVEHAEKAEKTKAKK